MLQGWVVIAVALGYIGLLFLVASYGDRIARRSARERPDARLLIYPLSLAIYCTSWTFFGSVGLASRTGYDFLTIYIGPVLMIGLCIAADRAHRAARQGAEHHLDRRLHRGALRQEPGGRRDRRADRDRRHRFPTSRCSSRRCRPRSRPSSRMSRRPARMPQPLLGDIALFVALSMATFAVLFGTRHIDATEHQDGLMLAIADRIDRQAGRLPRGRHLRDVLDVRRPGRAVQQAMRAAATRRRARRASRVSTRSLTMTLLSFVAIILLPRQFHVAVVENHNEDEIKRAAWLFPLYLVLINLFVVPIALAGLLTSRAGEVDSDMFVLALPLHGRIEPAHHRRLRRRPVGGDRDGDRRIGRALDHGVERPRHAAGAAAARGADRRPRERRRAAADRAAARDLRRSCCSPTCITARPATRSSPRSACCRSRRSRSSRRPFSAA